jgi:hypothetical protein
MAQDLREGRGFCFIDKHGDAAIRDNRGQQMWLPTDLPSLDEGPLSSGGEDTNKSTEVIREDGTNPRDGNGHERIRPFWCGARNNDFTG